MKEAKTPKRLLIYDSCIVLRIILVFNLLDAPRLSQSQVVEVGYGTLMDMIAQVDVGTVQVEDTQILLADKDGTAIYETVPIEDIPSLSGFMVPGQNLPESWNTPVPLSGGCFWLKSFPF